MAGRRFHFEAGETIHTENSYKYAPEHIAGMAAQSGFRPGRTWTDPDRLFSLSLLVPLAASER